MKHSVYGELPFDEVKAPAKTEYECDILVVGGGYAGLSAAVSARRMGMNVVLVDKGCPGYSGQSPHACCTRWFDPEMGDDRETMERLYYHDAEHMGNQKWFEVWLDESKSVYEMYRELGLTEQYPDANTTGFAEDDDYFGYRDLVGGRLRHKRFLPALQKSGVTVVTHTMVYDVVEEQGRIIGAVGFHVASGTPIVFHAGATVLCMGSGAYRPAGWPTGGTSFDAIAIGYRHGLPVIGQEFEDYHSAKGDSPSNAWVKEAFPYLQNLMLNGGEERRENLPKLTGTGSAIANCIVEGGVPYDSGAPSWHPYLWKNSHPEDVRNNRVDTDEPKNQPGGVYGVAPGMPVHTAAGIFCGCEDTVGYTGIPGLYCAGDGCNGGPVGGPTYAGRTGFTSNFFGLQGKRAGEAAAEYIKTSCLDHEKITPAQVAQCKEAYYAPMQLEKGYDVVWALDCLHAVMTPFWTLLVKREERLQAALTNVLYIRDHVLPKVMALSAHDLKNCFELKNKVLQAEMKLRLSLERKESRGGHYREDYPFRDDENFLCYLVARQDSEKTMKICRVDYPDAWKGDLDEPYQKRYTSYYPGELEAARERGWICPEERSSK